MPVSYILFFSIIVIFDRMSLVVKVSRCFMMCNWNWNKAILWSININHNLNKDFLRKYFYKLFFFLILLFRDIVAQQALTARISWSLWLTWDTSVLVHNRCWDSHLRAHASWRTRIEMMLWNKTKTLLEKPLFHYL